MKNTRKEVPDYYLELSHKTNRTMYDQNQGLIRDIKKTSRKECHVMRNYEVTRWLAVTVSEEISSKFVQSHAKALSTRMTRKENVQRGIPGRRLGVVGEDCWGGNSWICFPRAGVPTNLLFKLLDTRRILKPSRWRQANASDKQGPASMTNMTAILNRRWPSDHERIANRSQLKRQGEG